jgi:hypothetical protein
MTVYYTEYIAYQIYSNTSDAFSSLVTYIDLSMALISYLHPTVIY